MKDFHAMGEIRASNWQTLPTAPGVYWWYFPVSCLTSLGIDVHCAMDELHLRMSPGGDVCLYHGSTSNLRARIKWHADQKLTESILRSGFLSTFRFSLLALHDFDYTSGNTAINSFIDTLSVTWQTCASKASAESLEADELAGNWDYPINIARNRSPRVADFLKHLRKQRKTYKARYI